MQTTSTSSLSSIDTGEGALGPFSTISSCLCTFSNGSLTDQIGCRLPAVTPLPLLDTVRQTIHFLDGRG
jgi:hypothetical protein